MIYTLELNCSNINLLEHKDAIERAVKRYNEKKYAMQNPKFLVVQEIRERSILLTLESSLPLSVPGKALRMFSMDLITNEGFVPSASGQLFRTRLVSEEQSDLEEEIPHNIQTISDLSDAELLKGLIEYIVNNKSTGTPTEYRKKRAALEHIKQITLDSGIIARKK